MMEATSILCQKEAQKTFRPQIPLPVKIWFFFQHVCSRYSSLFPYEKGVRNTSKNLHMGASKALF